ncbi:MAG: DUF3422 family protein, partial [Pseudomonadota bacterium]
QRVLAFMEGTARSPTESTDQSPPNNNEYLSQSNEAIDAIYEDVWSYLGLGANDLEEHFQKYCAALTRRYDEVTQSEVRRLGIRDEALARAALTYLEIEQHGSELKLRESSGDDRYAGHLEIAAVFDGCVVRRSKDTITTERNRGLRDRQLNDLEEYNSRIYPHDLSDFYSDYNDADISTRFEGGTQRVMRDNIRHLQDRSIFFKRVLGFWPKNNRPNRHKDVHGGSAILCGVLDGLGIYGCSIGIPTRQADKETTQAENSDISTVEPDQETTQADTGDTPTSASDPKKAQTYYSHVRYFLLYAGPSRNQLSRLIRRLHFCGENRILLETQFLAFKNTSLKLANVARDIDQQVIKANLSQSFLDEKRQQIEALSAKVRGGLHYRVARADYYWSTLLGRVQDLRVRRILGWQTYPEFLERVYAPQARSFERTGQELADVETRLARAEEVIETKTAGKLARAALAFAILTAVGLISDAFRILHGDKYTSWQFVWLFGGSLFTVVVGAIIYVMPNRTSRWLREVRDKLLGR